MTLVFLMRTHKVVRQMVRTQNTCKKIAYWEIQISSPKEVCIFSSQTTKPALTDNMQSS